MGTENMFRGPESDPTRDQAKGNKSRIKSLLRSGMGEGYCMQILQEALIKDYGVDANTVTEEVKAKLQNAALELFRDTNANREFNAEQTEAVASRVMDVLDQVSKEIQAEAANNNPEASQEQWAA